VFQKRIHKHILQFDVAIEAAYWDHLESEQK